MPRPKSQTLAERDIFDAAIGLIEREGESALGVNRVARELGIQPPSLYNHMAGNGALMHPTIRVGEWAKLRAAKELEHIINWIAPCPPFNVTGQPAISVPVGFTPENLPLGVQLVGHPGDETTILTLAAQIEATKPWSHHRPKFAC